MWTAFELKVGDMVGYCRYHSIHVLGRGCSKVAKINGFGHIFLEDGKRFDKGGSQYKVKYGALQLVEYGAWMADVAAEEHQRKMDQAMVNVLRYIEGRKTGSGHYIVNATVKETLLSLVNEL